jgi:hypothetical protein
MKTKIKIVAKYWIFCFLILMAVRIISYLATYGEVVSYFRDLFLLEIVGKVLLSFLAAFAQIGWDVIVGGKNYNEILEEEHSKSDNL